MDFETLLHVIGAATFLVAFPPVSVLVILYFLQRRKGDA